MNTIEHYVEEVYEAYNRWWVKVMSNSYGRISPDSIMCNTLEEALTIKIGHRYDA